MAAVRRKVLGASLPARYGWVDIGIEVYTKAPVQIPWGTVIPKNAHGRVVQIDPHNSKVDVKWDLMYPRYTVLPLSYFGSQVYRR